jgi:hypothetical protein
VSARTKLRQLHEQQLELETRIDDAVCARRAAEAELEGVAGREAEVALGERDQTDVDAFRNQHETACEAADAEIRSCRSALVVLQGRVEEAGRLVELEDLDQALAQLEERIPSLQKAEKELAGAARAVIAKGAALVALRDQFDAIHADAVKLAAAAGVAAPAERDEPDWAPPIDAWRDVDALVLRGPRKPATEAAARADREAEAEERARIARAELPGQVVDRILRAHRYTELPATLAELDTLDRVGPGGVIDGNAANTKASLLLALEPLAVAEREWVLRDVHDRRAAGVARREAELEASRTGVAGPVLAPEPGGPGVPLAPHAEVS